MVSGQYSQHNPRPTPAKAVLLRALRLAFLYEEVQPMATIEKETKYSLA